MRLQTLSLENFRNHEQLAIEFGPSQNVNYIVGPNALGKTNILEAIYLLALVKSFRGQKSTELIKWGSEFARIKAVFADDGDNSAGVDSDSPGSRTGLEIFLGNPPQPQKALKVNGVKTTAEKFIGRCKVVLFTPEDLNLLYLGPDLRRRYLDILNIQVKPHYYRALHSYKKTLEQRNSLLRQVKEGRVAADQLDIWDQRLVEFGSILMAERIETTDFLKLKIQEIYRKISRKDEEVGLVYKISGIPALDHDDGNLKYHFDSVLKENRSRDIEAGITTSGPHRDDLVFFINGRRLHEHASRGEYRSLLLALKLLELDFHRENGGEKPILLLDDVFSELDDERRSMLVNSIQDHQTLITSTKVGEHFIERTHRGLIDFAREPNIIKVGA